MTYPSQPNWAQPLIAINASLSAMMVEIAYAFETFSNFVENHYDCFHNYVSVSGSFCWFDIRHKN